MLPKTAWGWSLRTRWMGLPIGRISGVPKSRHTSLPPPTLRERRHRGLACRLVAVRRSAILMMTKGQRPHVPVPPPPCRRMIRPTRWRSASADRRRGSGHRYGDLVGDAFSALLISSSRSYTAWIVASISSAKLLASSKTYSIACGSIRRLCLPILPGGVQLPAVCRRKSRLG
jgi:hypothetical protein